MFNPIHGLFFWSFFLVCWMCIRIFFFEYFFYILMLHQKFKLKRNVYNNNNMKSTWKSLQRRIEWKCLNDIKHWNNKQQQKKKTQEFSSNVLIVCLSVVLPSQTKMQCRIKSIYVERVWWMRMGFSGFLAHFMYHCILYRYFFRAFGCVEDSNLFT